MTNPRAVLVDDDPQQLAEASSTIIDAGFELTSFESVEDALDFIENTEELIDLFVLDRKLPMRVGEKAVDELGDELFRIVTTSHPDSRVIVFSGYTDFDHAQESMEGSGLVFQDEEVRVDRVSVLRKSQFNKFERFIRDLREIIARFDLIELTVSGTIDFAPKESSSSNRLSLRCNCDIGGASRWWANGRRSVALRHCRPNWIYRGYRRESG